jgi:hypothetical protein
MDRNTHSTHKSQDKYMSNLDWGAEERGGGGFATLLEGPGQIPV